MVKDNQTVIVYVVLNLGRGAPVTQVRESNEIFWKVDGSDKTTGYDR